MPLEPLDVPNRIGHTLRMLIVVVPVTVLLFGSLILFNCLQVLSLLLIPVSRKTFRRANRWMADVWWGLCVVLAERMNGTRLEVSGDPLPRDENALLTANHQQMPDITTIMALARSHGRLGDLRWFVKEPLRWIPGVGWGMWILGCIYVRRDWTKDQEKLSRAFATLRRERLPVWLITFPEGTRVTREKIEHSREYAQRVGRNALEHVLLPRTKGFAATIGELKDHIAAVYDVTLGYEGGVPTLWQFICGHVRKVHLHVRRFPTETLPDSLEELSVWLHDRFEEKDRLLEVFYRTGAFPTAERAPSAASDGPQQAG